MRSRVGPIALVLLALALGTLSCSAPGAVPSAQPETARLRRVAILPFRTAGFLDSAGRFVDDTSAGDMPDDLGTYVADRRSTDLTGLGTEIVPADVVLRATPVAGAALYDTKLAVRVAREVGADAAVFGAVHRFVQRRGSALSVESPASVEYQAMVVAADTGIVIGSYLFDFTQKPLAADLTQLPDFVQGGGKWRTREDILDKSLVKTAAKIAGTVGIER
jgi:hypothetical protein